ncbi:MAG: SDR family oxidoreductase [Xanthomonadales bacterium]|nr:SDR family oxidoreductase [Xanthomonadales bacterium]
MPRRPASRTSTRSVATMYGHRGIRCNAVAPGLILSPAALDRLSEEQLASFARHRLLAHTGEPEDIAWMVGYLASDLGRYITGQTINVDGGVLAHFPAYADALDRRDLR